MQDVIQASSLGSLRGTVELLELDHKVDAESYCLLPVKTTEPVEIEEWDSTPGGDHHSSVH